MTLLKFIFIIAMTMVSGHSFAYRYECPRACDRPADCKKSLFIGAKKIDFYSNYPLSVSNDCIDSVIVVVHGAERNAEGRYDAVLDAAKSLGRERRTLIISPFFKTDDDARSSSDFYWSSSGWRQGDVSINSGATLSSFAVVDNFLHAVFDYGRFVNLVRASVTGHSAGGQLAQMFALTTSSPEEHPAVKFNFVVLNPSNYTYLNNYRPHPDVAASFEIPVTVSGTTLRMKPAFRAAAGNCPNDFNDYKYGFEERNAYAGRLSSTTLTAQYLARTVSYVLGGLDNDPNHESLDTSCEAKLQGTQRLQRGQNYFNALNLFYPGHAHSIDVVPGVGHDARGMYDSDEVKRKLF